MGCVVALLTKHSEPGLALGVPGGHPVHLADEHHVVREAHVLDEELGAVTMGHGVHPVREVRLVVHHAESFVAVVDALAFAAAHRFLQEVEDEEEEQDEEGESEHSRLDSADVQPSGPGPCLKRLPGAALHHQKASLTATVESQQPGGGLYEDGFH